jgi:hypothetical protein
LFFVFPTGLQSSLPWRFRSSAVLTIQDLVIIKSIAIIGLVIWGLSEIKKTSLGEMVEQARSALSEHGIQLSNIQEMVARELKRRDCRF